MRNVYKNEGIIPRHILARFTYINKIVNYYSLNNSIPRLKKPNPS